MTFLSSRVVQAALLMLMIWTNAANAFTVPPYGPSFWNSSSRQYYNNCYNYSTNVATNTFAQPGAAFAGNRNHITSANMNCPAVTWFAALDGTVGYAEGQSSLRFMGNTDPGTCALGGTKVALVIDPGYDYHWYRLDSNNRWSHKRGQTQAKDRDESGHYIYNPETANRAGYTEFCGYFCTASSAAQQNTGLAQVQ